MHLCTCEIDSETHHMKAYYLSLLWLTLLWTPSGVLRGGSVDLMAVAVTLSATIQTCVYLARVGLAFLAQ